MSRTDIVPFFRAWIANPLQVAAVAPSGQALAELMTSEIKPDTGPVLELGPGMGVFTRALLARGVDEHDLTLVEYGSDFVRVLGQRFPDARILWMDAARLAQTKVLSGAPYGAVISGLPLLSMSPRKIIAILSGAFGYLRSDGSFYQFTYGPRCPIPLRILDRAGLKASCIGRTLMNIPPAAVYRISRRRSVAFPPLANQM
ncbi:class I SAM-dependent methyltransferase [Pseudorhodoplanes sinuspersici]|uniref:SAM-dependent methyltransferase n=1 Tax=Pseudorhodoplanes sinuspersici TaxID=1235591 RepID=A0A1W6ZQD1_9HYPH|nr:SAM-dependent methyltransferase [Pseudorhodoplanes sinuspersici]ARP98974.1 SAM-dependent methyltransferase [Pseudorhodoplanes sinuspersici]RKE69390.1 phospholipid N-methyltransferase [Pseudorhodoplanes sinuspersici]